MHRTVLGLATLAFSAVLMAGAADIAKPAGGLGRETRAGMNSNSTQPDIPQLAPNLHVGPEVPMARETNAAAAPVAETAQPAARRKTTLWMILAVLVLLLGGPLLRRLRSQSDPQ